jgi:DNA-directed RNA polymerase specialized sigma24 family protein
MSETSQTDDDGIAHRSRELETKTTLSTNEAEVLARKEAGQTHSEIADTMGIEKGTVDSHAHRGRVKYNLAVTTVEELRPFYGENNE